MLSTRAPKGADPSEGWFYGSLRDLRDNDGLLRFLQNFRHAMLELPRTERVDDLGSAQALLCHAGRGWAFPLHQCGCHAGSRGTDQFPMSFVFSKRVAGFGRSDLGCTVKALQKVLAQGRGLIARGQRPGRILPMFRRQHQAHSTNIWHCAANRRPSTSRQSDLPQIEDPLPFAVRQ